MTISTTLPTFRAATTANDAGVNNINITTPAGMAATDFLVLSVVVRDDRVVTNPTDWTELFSYQALPNPGFTHYVYGRVAGAQGSPLNLVADDTTTWTAAMLAYQNVTDAFATAGVDGWGGQDGSGYLTAPLSLTSEEATSVGEQPVLALYLGATRAEGTITWTAPTGFTERVDTSYTSGTLRFSQTVAEATYASTPPPWTGTPAGTHPKEGSAYLLLVGTTVFTADAVLPTNPNEPFGIEVPFTDGLHTVYAGWSGALLLLEANLGGSAFRLNDDSFGRLNSGRLGPAADGWVDLGCYFDELSGTFGATQDDGVLTRFEAGTLQITLRNDEQVFDPLNPDGPYYQDLRLGTRVRLAGSSYNVLATHNPNTMAVFDTLWALFSGRIDAIGQSGFADGHPVITFDCVDDVGLLAAYDAAEQAGEGAGDDVEERVQRILDETQWDGTMQADVTHPSWPTATFSATTMAQPAWTEILLSTDAVNVMPTMRGDGVLYLQPIEPDTNDYLLTKFGCADADEVPVLDIELAHDMAQLRNVVDAARVGGTEVRVADSSSIARYGRHAWNRNDLPLQNDADVLAFAQFVVAHTSEADPRVTGVRVVPQLAGDELFHGIDRYASGVFAEALGFPVWYTVCQLIFYRYQTVQPISVRFDHPQTGREFSQMVAVRGAEVSISADYWETRFVTSNTDSFFDIWTLASPSASLEDAEQSRLSRGHRLAAA